MHAYIRACVNMCVYVCIITKRKRESERTNVFNKRQKRSTHALNRCTLYYGTTQKHMGALQPPDGRSRRQDCQYATPPTSRTTAS